MKHTIEQYREIVDQAKEIFLAKAKDYGTAWRILRPSSLTDQIFIKASRIRSIQEKGTARIDEKPEVEFLAIINYCIIALIQLELGSEGELKMDPARVELLYDKWYDKTFNLMNDKNHDYGEVWRDMRVSSITDLILMKLLRIKSIEDNEGETLVSEGLEANFQDILNYAVFALILLKENK